MLEVDAWLGINHLRLWKTTFSLEVFSGSASSQEAMKWILEVDEAKTS